MIITIYPHKKVAYAFKPTKRALASIKREVVEHCGAIGGAACTIVCDNGDIWDKTIMCRWIMRKAGTLSPFELKPYLNK